MQRKKLSSKRSLKTDEQKDALSRPGNSSRGGTKKSEHLSKRKAKKGGNLTLSGKSRKGSSQNDEEGKKCQLGVAANTIRNGLKNR